MLNPNSDACSSRFDDLLLAKICVSTAAPTQTAPTAGEGEEAEGEAIVVSGTPIRDSLEKSLQAQRDADNVASVIASGTIRRFPDALFRCEGIHSSADAGHGSVDRGNGPVDGLFQQGWSESGLGLVVLDGEMSANF